MKSKKDIQKLAQEIFELEKQADKFSKLDQHKNLQEVLKKIEIIMESLTLEEGLILNDAVINLLEKN